MRSFKTAGNINFTLYFPIRIASYNKVPEGNTVCAKSFNVGHPARFVGVVTVLLGLGSGCEEWGLKVG